MSTSIMENPNADPSPPSVQQKAAISALSPRKVTLRDGSPVTLYPIVGATSIPSALVEFLSEEFNDEIKRGCTYPMEDPMPLEKFGGYWFGTFGVVMLSGHATTIEEGRDWTRECLGTFYIKPNYPGRCSHVSNAGFLACTASRGKGVGRVLAETYLEWAPKLGYTYSVFNLVFANNAASVKIWDGLGFEQIGRVKGAARLANSDKPVDAIIYGRDLV